MRKLVREIGKRLCAFVVALTFGFIVYSLIPLNVPPENNDYYETIIQPKIHMAEVFKCAPPSLKPDPFLLLLEIDAERNLSLNRERIGSLDQTSELKNVLLRIFEERSQQNNYKENTFEVDRTVIIQPEATIKFTEIIKLIEDLEETGAITVQYEPEYCYFGGKLRII